MGTNVWSPKKHSEVEAISEAEDREELLVDVSQNTISWLDHLWQISCWKSSENESASKGDGLQ